MKDFLVSFDDLPDEILLHIFKHFNNIEALYYLIDLNQRLNRILRDPKFTSDLSLLSYYPKKNSISPSPDVVLDRFCATILPRIGDRVKTLWLEETTIDRILRAATYPNLSRLDLCNIDVKIATSLFLDTNSIVYRFKKQISSFVIKYRMPKHSNIMDSVHATLFTQILTNFTGVKYLKFKPNSIDCRGLCFFRCPLTAVSSALSELHVYVQRLDECLHILDGRFDQLRVLCVKIFDGATLPVPTDDTKKLLPNLRAFSLDCYNDVHNFEYIVLFSYRTTYFDESIVPVVRRMVNLEELHLTLAVECKNELIDGNTLKKHIISHLPRLKKFTFNIWSIVNHLYQTDVPSEQDIQKTFEYFYDKQIIISVDHFQEMRYSQYHIYSYPYKWKFYHNVTNNFPGGIFTSVTEVSLHDERPFEYEFFHRIAESFPFMKILKIKNWKAQNDKEFIKLANCNKILSIIKYPHLTTLDLYQAHDDYIELFLLDAITYLPNNVRLTVSHIRLERVTNNFTRSTTRNNCEKIGFLWFNMKIEMNERMKDYFPHAFVDCS